MQTKCHKLFFFQTETRHFIVFFRIFSFFLQFSSQFCKNIWFEFFSKTIHRQDLPFEVILRLKSSSYSNNRHVPAAVPHGARCIVLQKNFRTIYFCKKREKKNVKTEKILFFSTVEKKNQPCRPCFRGR
jgi:hypothetical protein